MVLWVIWLIWCGQRTAKIKILATDHWFMIIFQQTVWNLYWGLEACNIEQSHVAAFLCIAERECRLVLALLRAMCGFIKTQKWIHHIYQYFHQKEYSQRNENWMLKRLSGSYIPYSSMHTHTEILLSNNKEWNYFISTNLDQLMI